MSDNHSVMFNILKRNRLTSPSSNFKYSSFKDTCCTSVFLDSRSNESVKNSDVEHKEALSITSLSLLQEHSEHIHPNALSPVSSSIEKEMNSISLSERREANRSAGFFETPKVSRKGSSLRRRLLLSKTVPTGTTVECCERQPSPSGGSRKKICSCVLSFEEKLLQTASDSPKDKSYKPLTNSTSKTEDSNPDCPKRRLSFSQQRTSTLDESTCKDPLLLEPESLSPIQCKAIIVSNANEFNGSILTSVSDGLLRTPTYSMLPEANEGKFPISSNSLAENFNFEICDINSPPVKMASYPDLLTPEDSGYNSLHLDKSGDSLSDHERSFHEFFQKRKEGLKILHSKRKTRKLERVRRLSTLREQGSQSETEDHHGSPATSACMLTEERDFVSEDHALVLEEQPGGDLVVSYGDLSRTPALKIVHEICLQRQRSDQNQISENVDGTDIFALEHVLAGLIGKKMGLEKLDILTELKYRNLNHVLARVLDALTVESLCSIWKVSKNWREIIVQDKSADKRRKLYLQHLKEAEEYFLKAEDAATRLNVLNRSALRPVQAQARTPVVLTPPSYTELTPRRCSSVPHSTSRQEEYIKVAKTLFTDEALKPCPRCQYPAKYQLVKKRGLCSREACAFEFCILCLRAFHGSKECNSLSAEQKNKKDAPPGSAQSKRNLKRL
ncbi:F-box only protein 43 [Phalacrocorax carbo]|uniref:F-box only protein 43 n=1 Tax=Phalacrocorax carbo TaxID=9209 RepID=A0A093TAT6_PHACA|nr:PREDICTED: F-box only protein 43 [Phalacrocorax carbo]KFW91594.1 F-box only protein 43 [Phalacrocorax carbo]